jgi:hypothetical protein
MKLIKVKPSKKRIAICGIDEAVQSNYSTLCGWQLWNMDEEVVGEEFTGRHTEITFPQCKQVLEYFRGILQDETNAGKQRRKRNERKTYSLSAAVEMD